MACPRRQDSYHCDMDIAPRRKSTNSADYQDTPQPASALAVDYPNGYHSLPHYHRRAQLLFAITGIMTISTGQGSWVVPPSRALWIPPGVDHWFRASGAVRIRTLYVEPSAADAAGLPNRCEAVAVSPLLRELLIRAVEIPNDYEWDGPDGFVMRLILSEIRLRPALPLNLPMPSDERARKACAAVLSDLAHDAPLESAARAAGLSGRSLNRLLKSETGLSFGRWQRRARLLGALERLAEGASVLAVALDLGYDSPSAFTAMFRRELGMVPSRYFR
ncbi:MULTISPECIES: helix-turn-helix transcriptional regulator [Rhodomicrobium]|uniref:AraC family transcriptional regulator n=1 Tax=Rhodomicrobium TaxID=1068 RepID=UPI001FD8ECC4|nr:MULTISPECIES: helix-turn-helix transcriptional regulator [Rhodomicrobium]